MIFQLVMEYNGRWFRMTVERTAADAKQEIYCVTGGQYHIILKTDRPLALRLGRLPKWKPIGGRVRREGDLEAGVTALDLLFRAIEKEVAAEEKKAAGTAGAN